MESTETKIGKLLLKGDPVHKVKGYRWSGVVVSVFTNLAGEGRYVVECTIPGVEGALHIYSLRDLELGL